MREYWLVDDEAQFIEVYRRVDERFSRLGLYGPGQAFVSDVLNGTAIDPGEILSAS